jgi:SAM-dependent methyltransferase
MIFFVLILHRKPFTLHPSSVTNHRKWHIAQWAEIRWWKRYLRRKPPEAYLAWKTAYWKSFIQRLEIPLEPGIRALDAGCGPAGIYMSLEGCRVEALDPLLPAYADLEHFQPERYPWVSFFPEGLEDFHRENTYDLIFCLNAINHMADVPMALRRLCLALKKGGHAYISVDAHRSRELRWLFRRIPADVLHPFQEDLGGYRSLLEKAGFSVVNATLYEKGHIFDYWVFHLQKQS